MNPKCKKGKTKNTECTEIKSAFRVLKKCETMCNNKTYFFILLMAITRLYASPVTINPNVPEHSSFQLRALGKEAAVSPQFEIQSLNVLYTICNEYDITVYEEVKTTKLEDIPEYFFTEKSVFYTRIPEFSWSGHDANGNTVPDGEYQLSIQLVNGKKELLRDASGRSIIPEQKYKIIVDTASPKFKLAMQPVPESAPTRGTDISSLFFYTEGDFATSWKLDIFPIDSTIPVFSSGIIEAELFDSTLCPMPIIMWNTKDITGDFIAVVTAADSVLNSSEQRISFSLHGIDALEKKNRIELANMIALFNILKDKYSGCSVNLENAVYDSVSIPNGLIPHDSQYGISFRNADEEIFVPLEENSNVVSWTLCQENLPVGTYSMSLYSEYNGQKQELFLGKFLIKNDSLFPPEKAHISVEMPRYIYEDELDHEKKPVFSVKITLLEKPIYVESWSVDIFDKDENWIANLDNGTGDISPIFDDGLKWNGRDSAGNLVAFSGMEYIVKLFVNETAIASLHLNACLILQKEPDNDKIQIIVPDIIFPANESDLINDEQFFLQNYEILRAVINIVNSLPEESNKIIIEGFANPVTYPDQIAMKKEERENLLPLSLERAVVVKRMLILMGVPESRMEAVAGGGLKWISYPDDENEKYKNRRIHFYVK